MANISLHVTVTAVLVFVMVNSGNIGHQSLIDSSGRMFVLTSARAERGGWGLVVGGWWVGGGWGGGWGGWWGGWWDHQWVVNAKQCCHLS